MFYETNSVSNAHFMLESQEPNFTKAQNSRIKSFVTDKSSS